MRYAIYHAPEPGTGFWQRASHWLGRDAVSGNAVSQPNVDGLSESEFFEITSSARRYGFHGTLKAPFHMVGGKSENHLLAELENFCSARAPFELKMRTGSLDGFVALVPEQRSDELERLAADVVRVFDDFRAPLSEAELARRNPDALSPIEQEHLKRWGYPYVFDRFRFHMTLTARLDPALAVIMTDFANEWFHEYLKVPMPVAGLGLFVEDSPGKPFRLLCHLPFGASSKERPIQ